MHWPETGATHYNVQLGLPDKGRAMKGFVVCNSQDASPSGPTINNKPYVAINQPKTYKQVYKLLL